MSRAFSLLTVCGLDELESHAERGVTHALSIVDPGREDHPAFARYGAPRRLTLYFNDDIEPGPGLVLPERADVDAILMWGREAFAAAPGGGEGDGHLLVHCHMGISRSTAAMTMLLAQAHPEQGEAEIAERVHAIRPIAWPNLRMIEMADDALGRAGRLVAAAATLYAGNLARRPDLAEVMTRINRAREVELGRAVLAAAA
ncbi:tyrosine phosphatase family protein [Lichenibacterium dinghuense]|uniref:tyrosine phosphatase family protein n=1 Tax=Lichenibacterium dinghuense TaxID=2895977 RepID=UPI001F2504B9|nr:protein-tyrosine-phosphatase [Lichenibacterium sp. 6Y81]